MEAAAGDEPGGEQALEDDDAPCGDNHSGGVLQQGQEGAPQRRRHAKGRMGQPVVERGAVGPFGDNELRRRGVEVDETYLQADRPPGDLGQTGGPRSRRPRRALPMPAPRIGDTDGQQHSGENRRQLVAAVEHRGRSGETERHPPVQRRDDPRTPAHDGENEDRYGEGAHRSPSLGPGHCEQAPPDRRAARRPHESHGAPDGGQQLQGRMDRQSEEGSQGEEAAGKADDVGPHLGHGRLTRTQATRPGMKMPLRLHAQGVGGAT